MPKEVYALVAPPEEGGRQGRVVIDVGGDDRGTLALGRYVDDIRAGGDYEMLAVVNSSRPLTRTPLDAVDAVRPVDQSIYGFPSCLSHGAFPRGFPTGLSHVPPWCESILGVKVEAVQGKEVPLEWTGTSGGLWEWWHDPGVPLAFPLESTCS